MYDIKINRGNLWMDHYVYKSKNECNQIIVFEIFRNLDNKLNMCFYITSKRKKGFQYKKITGKDGIKSLIWAKNCLIHFIKYCEENNIYKNQIIQVYADDEKRYRVYKYALSKLGFSISYQNRSLYYKIDNINLSNNK